jgi:hypothetical protein
MRVIHRVPDTLTTKNRSRWISFNFVRDTVTTDFYSRLVRDRFTTRSNMLDLVMNLSRTSREVGSVAGDLANLRPECRHVIFTPSDVIM